ncbi:MAG TPA: biotin--[acetyl-CoA-carboxylase] ligase [Ruminococcaceae bacterium]|nr:biotin--[acetyl-CoA-carboxylase] ligase [Oscillospiraceae bacterium]
MHDLKSQIQSKLHHPMPVTVLETVDSTNRYLKETLEQSECTQQAVLAKTQTAGCGRSGKSFFSPADKGLYLSLFCPMKSYEDTVALTVKTSVAAAVAIETVCKKQVQIKWVNDLYYGSKKVCGILTQAVTNRANHFVGVIIGIGINLFETALPPEIADTAGALNAEKNCVAALAAAVIDNTMDFTQTDSAEDWYTYYTEHSMVLGQDITYFQNGIPHRAKAIGIDRQGGLMIQTPDGNELTLTSGEVSLRLTD